MARNGGIYLKNIFQGRRAFAINGAAPKAVFNKRAALHRIPVSAENRDELQSWLLSPGSRITSLTTDPNLSREQLEAIFYKSGMPDVEVDLSSGRIHVPAYRLSNVLEELGIEVVISEKNQNRINPDRIVLTKEGVEDLFTVVKTQGITRILLDRQATQAEVLEMLGLETERRGVVAGNLYVSRKGNGPTKEVRQLMPAPTEALIVRSGDNPYSALGRFQELCELRKEPAEKYREEVLRFVEGQEAEMSRIFEESEDEESALMVESLVLMRLHETNLRVVEGLVDRGARDSAIYLLGGLAGAFPKERGYAEQKTDLILSTMNLYTARDYLASLKKGSGLQAEIARVKGYIKEREAGLEREWGAALDGDYRAMLAGLEEGNPRFNEYYQLLKRKRAEAILGGGRRMADEGQWGLITIACVSGEAGLEAFEANTMGALYEHLEGHSMASDRVRSFMNQYVEEGEIRPVWDYDKTVALEQNKKFKNRDLFKAFYNKDYVGPLVRMRDLLEVKKFMEAEKLAESVLEIFPNEYGTLLLIDICKMLSGRMEEGLAKIEGHVTSGNLPGKYETVFAVELAQIYQRYYIAEPYISRVDKIMTALINKIITAKVQFFTGAGFNVVEMMAIAHYIVERGLDLDVEEYVGFIVKINSALLRPYIVYSNATLFYNRAKMALAAGRRKEAERFLRKAEKGCDEILRMYIPASDDGKVGLKQIVRNLKALVYDKLAECRNDQSIRRRGLDLLEKELQRPDAVLYYHYSLAILLRRAGDYDRAIESQRLALEESDDLATKVELAMLLNYKCVIPGLNPRERRERDRLIGEIQEGVEETFQDHDKGVELVHGLFLGNLIEAYAVTENRNLFDILKLFVERGFMSEVVRSMQTCQREESFKIPNPLLRLVDMPLYPA